MNYSPEFKEAIFKRMLPPNNESITRIPKEEGIPERTLRNWRRKARSEGISAPGKDVLPDDWSTQDKLLIVVETASMNAAREWVSLLVKWYNYEHHHSGLNFLTPDQMRSEKGSEILEQRHRVYETAKAAHPERWNGRDTRDWSMPELLCLYFLHSLSPKTPTPLKFTMSST